MGERGVSEGARRRLDASSYARRFLIGECSFVEIERVFLDLLSQDIEAAGLLIPALKKRGSVLDSQQRATRDWLIGRYFEAKSDHRNAISWTLKALKTFRASGVREKVHLCLRLLASAYHYLGRHQKAKEVSDAILSDPLLPNLEKLKVIANMGALEYRVHNYGPALDHFQTALRLLEEEPHPKFEAIIRHNLANLLVCLHEFGEAESNFERALTLFHSLGIQLYEATVLQSYGNLYSILGQYYYAESRLKQARTLYLEGGDQFGAALCDLDFYHMGILLNRYEEVLDLVDPLVEMFGDLGRLFEKGLVYYEGIEAALAVGEEALAREYLDRAARLFKRENNRHYLALCDLARARMVAQGGRARRGLTYLTRAEAVFVEEGHKELELQCILDRLRYCGTMPDEETVARVKVLLKAPLGPRVRTDGLILMSSYWYEKGQYRRSCRALFEAIYTIEETRASISSTHWRESFFEDKARVYELLIERLFQWRHRDGRKLVFKVIELSRGRQMTELLSRREALPPVLNRNEPLLLELDRLNTRLNQLNRKLESMAAQTSASDAEKTALLHSVKETRGEIDELHGRMRGQNRLGLYFPIDLEVEELQNLLPEGTLLVCYFVGGNVIYRLELDAQGLRTYSNPIYAGFERDFNQLMTMLSMPATSPERLAVITDLADRLSAVLVPSRVKSVRHITFVLHKNLQKFPLSLLRHRGRFLVESVTMSQCPNLSTLYFALKRAASRFQHPVFFFSNQAQDPSAPERETLCRLFPNATVHARLPDKPVGEVVGDSDFIHFAGHCYFNRRNPADSFLELAGKRIYLEQFAEMRLDCPFINLASCRSGSVVLAAGNEPYGFVITLFAAGASQILASLWDIDDRVTGAWMNCFYDNLHLGLAESYRKACLTVMESFPDPHLWAGFCLLGRP